MCACHPSAFFLFHPFCLFDSLGRGYIRLLVYGLIWDTALDTVFSAFFLVHKLLLHDIIAI